MHQETRKEREGFVELVIAQEDPRLEDVRALLDRHYALGDEFDIPPQDRFALDIDGLLDSTVTFCTARLDGVLVGIGALKELDGSHGEVKSMHTAQAARRQGVASALVRHLLAIASARNYQRVSLETGNTDDFAGARSMYAKAGFVPCPPFGEYVNSGTSFCMTIALHSPR